MPDEIAFWDEQRGLLGRGEPYRRSGGAIALTINGGRTSRVVKRTGSGIVWLDTAGYSDAWATVRRRNDKERLLHSADGGETWQTISKSAPWAPSFSTPSDGIALENPYPENDGEQSEDTRLVVTDDGGQSWKPLADPCPNHRWDYPRELGGTASMASPTDWYVLCLDEGFTGMQPKSVFATTNGGRRWKEIANEGSCTRLHGLCTLGFAGSLRFDASGTGVLLGSDLSYRTRDGGRHWSRRWLRRDPYAQSVADAAPLPGETLLALHAAKGRTKLVISHDGGHSWSVVKAWPWHAGPGRTRFSS